MLLLSNAPLWPFAVLLIGIAAVVFMISALRFHPFVALILAAILVGLVAPSLPLLDGEHMLKAAVELPMKEFGIMAGKIAWVIALAAVIGTAMMESGAAERIVNWLMDAMGEKRAALALMLSGFLLSIPVFFDTVFFLLIPLAIALRLRTGKNFLLYVMAMSGGGVITHSLVPPTPGPLIMAESLSIDLGITIMGGLAAGLIPAILVLYVAKRMNMKMDIPLRIAVPEKIEKTVRELPGLLPSLMPVLVPLILISLVSVTDVTTGSVPGWMEFLGNKNIAMGLGALIALWLWAKQAQLPRLELWKGVQKPLEIAGIIILITSAGGAFGAMIKHAGIGNAIEYATQDFDVHYLLLAWFIAALMKTAQGSSTVAMITTASIMVALIGTGADLPYHPIYVLLAIGFGALVISWMNDSGFWVVAKMSGFTEKEALKTWTVLLALIGVAGLVQVMVFSTILPLR